MAGEKLRYLSYLLRLWEVGCEDQTTWRASLENPHSGERIGFGSLDELCRFLQEKTKRSLRADGEDAGIRSPL